MSSETTTHDAVVWAYRPFRGREPESDGIIAPRLAGSPELSRLREAFARSGEYRARAALNLLLWGDKPRTIEKPGERTLLQRLWFVPGPEK